LNSFITKILSNKYRIGSNNLSSNLRLKTVENNKNEEEPQKSGTNTKTKTKTKNTNSESENEASTDNFIDHPILDDIAAMIVNNQPISLM